MNGWHPLAAILSVMTVRCATHRIAALHCLLGRGHADAVQRVARESDGEHCNQHPACKPHDNQSRGTTVRESRLGVARDRGAREREGRLRDDTRRITPYHQKKERVRLRNEKTALTDAVIFHVDCRLYRFTASPQ